MTMTSKESKDREDRSAERKKGISPTIKPDDASKEEPLPDGWARMFSRTKKKHYYFNVATRKSQWLHPNSATGELSKSASSTSSISADSTTAALSAAPIQSPEELEKKQKRKRKKGRSKSDKASTLMDTNKVDCSPSVVEKMPGRHHKVFPNILSDSSKSSEKGVRNPTLKRSLPQECVSSKKLKQETISGPKATQPQLNWKQQTSVSKRKKTKAKRFSPMQKKLSQQAVKSESLSAVKDFDMPQQKVNPSQTPEKHVEQVTKVASRDSSSTTCHKTLMPIVSKPDNNTTNHPSAGKYLQSSSSNSCKTSQQEQLKSVHLQGSSVSSTSFVTPRQSSSPCTPSTGQAGVTGQVSLQGEEAMETEDYTEQILAVRSSLSRELLTEEATGQFTQKLLETSSSVQPVATSSKLYLVIDSNILIEHLPYIKALQDLSISEIGGEPVLVIPWMVLQELDAIKHDRGKLQNPQLQAKARQAIRYLNECIESGHPRLQAESIYQQKRKIDALAIKCNDDWLIHCCLVWKNDYPEATVLLLSHDTNLRSKTIVNGVQAFGVKAFHEKYVSGGTRSQPYTPPSMRYSTPTPATFTPTQCTTQSTNSSDQNSRRLGYSQSSSQARNTGSVSHPKLSPLITPNAASNIARNMPSNVTPNVTRTATPRTLNISQSRQITPQLKSTTASHSSYTVMSSTPSTTSRRDSVSKQSSTSHNQPSDTARVCGEILCEVQSLLTDLLGAVLKEELIKVYGENLWTSIVYRKPPWTLMDILESINKHWIAVFGMIMSREAQAHLQSLLTSFKGSSVCTGVIGCEQILANSQTFCSDLPSSKSTSTMQTSASKDFSAYQQILKGLKAKTLKPASLTELMKQHSHKAVTIAQASTSSNQPMSSEDTCMISTSPAQVTPPHSTLGNQPMSPKDTCMLSSSPAKITPHHSTQDNQPMSSADGCVIPTSPAPVTSPPGPPSAQAQSVTSLEQKVMQAFQRVWEAIIHHRDGIAVKLSNGEAESKNYLWQFCVILAVLHHHYSSLLSVDPPSLGQHVEKLVATVRSLDSCAQEFAITDWQGISMEELGTFYQQPGKREVLDNGLQQLMDIAKSLIDYQQQHLSQAEISQIQQACNQAVENSQHSHTFT